jgi:aspartate/methionine/tyrosine aminotransferase
MPQPIDPFHSIGLSRIAHQLKAEGANIIHMEFGQPSSGAPSAAIEAAHRVLDSEAMGYWESPRLKARLSRHYGETYGVEVASDRIILTCGASPALVLALTSNFDPGGQIALARPGYTAYRNTLKALNLSPLEIPCSADDRFQLSARVLESLDPAPAGVILASPANPTGTLIEGRELAAIAAVCRARGIRIISDEIYHGLVYTGQAHSMLEFEPDCLVVNSFSKYFSMVGWRIGWLVVPPDQIHRARAFASHMFLTSPSLSQHGALAALDSREELNGHVEVYRKNRALMLEALPSLGLARIAPPDGAFYLYADIGHLTDNSLAFCETMLRETGVCAAPGLDFDPLDGGRFIRFSFAVSTAEVEEALRRMRPWFAARTRVV